ncbi:Zn-dependent exopeptidase [Rhizopus microsporus ATCC 52813]|uniref:Zn-dependent exopeptidase n=2 Tax=Rhizopus microsporus TaxID=58291 RepID=A0A2G4SMV2_RHIZD|nr:Zn-dependent exopeptidase [Rhizopus microsporus ATCC 52813]PHZ10099.1 Zn-dependent exopeptidase [Rhizopus microsporus ATCC 52813]
MDLDSTFGDSVQLLVTHDGKPAERIVVSPTGTIYNDFDDVRRFKDAAYAAGIKALKAGMRRPLVCFADEPSSSLAWSFDADQDDYQHFAAVALMGLFESTFEPVDVRQHAARTQATIRTFESLGFVADVDAETVKTIKACEMGRRVAKDIGNPDPEIMSPIHITEYIQEQFKDVDNIKLTIIDDVDVIKKEYPLAHAVTRASLAVPRHHPRFILFEYSSPDQSQVKENLYFVGKGVTYDTGGADIKCSGHMRDMSRDKCGAAAVAGFFKTVSLLAPTKVNVTGGLALVRNSVGPDMYVSDEIIVARSGKRVMVGNTDAEGRMVMTDLLCQFKEKVLEHKQANTPSSAAPSFLFTCATLTGHAIRAYGGYGITLDNGFARKHKISKRIYNAGHVLGDPFEISTLRREDVECVKGGRSSEDLVSANDLASTMTNRGHQYPAGFMLQASGLDQYGLDNRELSIGYTHLDVAGSAELLAGEGWSIPRVTGSPVAALTGAFLF